nr:hypothetical protein [Tanacetum cinerariifolium]
MQTPVPSPLRPNRTDLSSDKTVTKDLTVFDTPMSYVPSQDPTKLTSSLCTHLQGVITRMYKRQATNDLIKDNLSRLVTDAVKKEIESSQADNTVLNVHTTTITSTATTSDLQQQLYLKMKSDFQSQVVDPELWNALKANYEKSSASTNAC